ncbi:MAG: hypothetical protein LC797_23210 [Chloroflexi bacterium]|nr:hypothetical protein [Chloroflexota bacterium]
MSGDQESALYPPARTFYERMMPRVPDLLQQPPSKELSRAFWLIGDWETGGHVYAQGSQPEFDGSHSEVIRCSLVLNGHALRFSSPVGEETCSKVSYLYVDPYDHTWMNIDIEPNVVYQIQRAPGWNGDLLEFEGLVRIFDDVAVWRHRLVRLPGDEWRWENDEQMPDGTWRQIDYHWYRRVPA